MPTINTLATHALNDTDLTDLLRDIDHPPREAYQKIASRARHLYEAAKQKSWNASLDLEWPESLPTDVSPTDEQDDPLAAFPPFENLSLAEQIDVRWQRHALEINDILHGEQAAMLLAAQLVNCLPDGTGKLFACSQVADEARHVEFFARYLHLLSRHLPEGKTQPPSPALARFIRQALQNPAWDMKLINCQILLESLALARFQELRRTTRIPLLRKALKLIMRDEARHTHFGIVHLRDYLKSLPAEMREAKGQYVLDQTVQLIHSDRPMGELARQFGWQSDPLRHHLRLARLRRSAVIQRQLTQLRDNMAEAALLTRATEMRLRRLSGISL